MQQISAGAGATAALLCIAFGANAVAIKICLAQMGGFTLAASRFAVAAAVLSLWGGLTGRSFKLRPGQLRQMAGVSLLFTLQSALFYVGMETTNASRGTLIANLQPFFVLFFAHFLVPGDRITARKLIGITLGFVGVASLFVRRDQATAAMWTGDLIVFSAVVFWALNAVYIKRIIGGYTVFQITVYPMYFLVPILGLLALVADDPVDLSSINTIWIAFAYQALITAALGFVIWNTLQQKYGVVATHTFVFLIPVSGVALGGLMLGEPVFHWNVLVALALIVSGIFVVQVHRALSWVRLPQLWRR